MPLGIVLSVTRQAVPNMTSFPKDLINKTTISAELQADLKLARQYACQGPRYTSYPTAPQFRQDFPQDQYFNWQRNQGDLLTAPLSLYIHLPFLYEYILHVLITERSLIPRLLALLSLFL